MEETKRKLPVTRTRQFDADLKAARLLLGSSSDAETVRQVLYQWVRRQPVCQAVHTPERRPIGDT